MAEEAAQTEVLQELRKYKSNSSPVGMPESLHRPVPSAEGSIGELTPGFSSSSQLTPQFLSTAQEQRIKANASNSGPVQSGPSKLAVESDELMAVLQKRVTELQKQNLALESQVRSAEENKKRLEQALKEKVELQVSVQFVCIGGLFARRH